MTRTIMLDQAKRDRKFREDSETFWRHKMDRVPAEFFVMDVEKWEVEVKRYEAMELQHPVWECPECRALVAEPVFAVDHVVRSPTKSHGPVKICSDCTVEEEAPVYMHHRTEEVWVVWDTQECEIADHRSCDGTVELAVDGKIKPKHFDYWDDESDAEKAVADLHSGCDPDYDCWPYSENGYFYLSDGLSERRLTQAGFQSAQYEPDGRLRYTVWDDDGDKSKLFALVMEGQEIELSTGEKVFVDPFNRTPMEHLSVGLQGGAP